MGTRLTGKNMTDAEMLSNIFNNTWRDGNTDCWHWSGTITKDGHGLIQYLGKKSITVHRFVMYLTTGFPYNVSKLPVIHKCYIADCVNPNHLKVGTYTENNFDTVDSGHHRGSNKTHC